MADAAPAPAPVPARRRPWRTVRSRAALGAALVVGVFLVLGSFVFVALLSASLRGSVEQGAAADAELVAAQVEASGEARIPASDDHLLVLVSADGSVLDVSDEDIVLPSPLPRGDSFTATVDDEPVVFVGEDVEVAGQDVRVLAGRSLEDSEDAVSTVVTLLVVAVVVLVLLVGLTAWVVVGRALAPVERIRSEVAGLEAHELDRRVQVPPSGDEVTRLAETMNEMLGRLDRAQAAQRRFVSDASHELRSPLAAMRQYAEVAAAHPDRVAVTELAGTVLAEGARVQDLVESLLLLARLDERSRQGSGRPVDLDDLLLAEASRLRGAGTVAVDASKIGAARARGDEALLGRVVRNLVDNAVRHARSTVTLASWEQGGVVRVVVEDDGAGVPVAERGRVFERFVRLDEARARDDGGSGLGLAIVADAVRLHGGAVEVGDGTGGGARFTVTLPAVGDA
ncbi:sensor histidine kinase [Sanguibacter keddieii]|uniref:sensor histidine kinase n=1 Tax=Sanguibacter keddieii TaxID=60920 RepID=UPI0002E3EF8B|nr:HAMP domain-containing sensor histidine kinase [Sanguibacter keddieii]